MNIYIHIFISLDHCNHYSDLLMSAAASQITGVSIIYTTICSGTDQWKYQSSASLAFVKEIKTKGQ